MCIQLIGILLILMLANQILGTGYGSWKFGFSRALFFRGVRKILLLLIGYGVIALAAHFASEYIPKIEYLSGILLEPIAKYFTKVCDLLKKLLNESATSEAAPTNQLPGSEENALEEASVKSR